ncbi:glycoside hydrolase family 44-domain-containing protein [Epithele typhae]|uniref:glycoside hydrolase family 44-domain-containing protein n=1 Tax=Epithele typhae TaxID=378194 RepID=UPI002008DBBF|nr:glycoside hydrolase family 44-domain-containing protein [Epithele typhae]KAH9933597.1 glycoside hydrolase family 44-domain-containing protein [Epithele typhae]
MLASFLALLSLGTIAAADLTVYQSGTGALASGWENWSWSTTLDFASTGGPGGVQSISVNSGEWAALSVYAETAFKNNYAGLRFQISGNQPDVSLYLSSSSDSASSVSMPLSSMSTIVNTTAFTEITVDFGNLPGNKGVLPQDSCQNGATYYLTNVMLLSELVITPEFLSAEPIGNNIIMVTSKGAVDFSKLSVKLNNATAKLTKIESYSPADTPAQTITYFTLSVPLAAGSLSISTGSNTTFSFVIPKLQYGTITIGNLRNISDDIYGMNFPTSADYIKLLGITMSRWGGNAVTAYNPDGAFTNAGNDWYFENRGSSPDDQGWLQFVQDGGSRSIFTIPALDWVAKDGTSYSYPATAYPDQRSFDPYKPDAGDGQFPNGSWVTPLPQTNVYTPWNASMAKSWMQSMKLKPTIITVDNEIEIASSTHQDMHPNPMGYDEELQRVLNIAKAAKSADSNLLVAAPSTCAWWFYWTSEIGYSDNAAHNNQDFLPWFLSQMKSASDAAGERLLDYLDIHYYFGPDTSANDAASKALRLRMTRSFWDPTYTDESWIGTSVPAQWNEPNPNQVWLIPRFQQLIAQHFPGTKLSISEWSSSAPDGDVTGGLVTADSLGIFGVYGLDSATYWVTADQLSPVGLAYWLFRGNGTYFGNKSIQVNMADSQPDVLGVYASTSDGKKVTMVIVNKDVVPINLAISNIPEGKYFLRHFGGAAGVAKWQTTITIKANSNFVIPAYTAVFFQQQ